MNPLDVWPVKIDFGTTLAEAEQDLIEMTMRHCVGYKPTVAAVLGISLKTLYNRLHRYEADSRKSS